MFLDHTGEKPLALCSEDGRIVFIFTAYIPTYFGATESTVFEVSTSDTNTCSYEAVSLAAKPPARLIAFIAGLLIDP